MYTVCMIRFGQGFACQSPLRRRNYSQETACLSCFNANEAKQIKQRQAHRMRLSHFEMGCMVFCLQEETDCDLQLSVKRRTDMHQRYRTNHSASPAGMLTSG